MPATAAAWTGRPQPCSDPPRLVTAWPLRSCLELAAELTAAGRARAWTRKTLRGWELLGLADTAELIASELVTNAVLNASPGPGRPVIPFVLALSRDELLILVGDDNSDTPQVQHPAKDDENGRGLMLVDALSAWWGWWPLGDGAPGKVVWAVLSADRDAAVPAPPQDDGGQGVSRPHRALEQSCEGPGVRRR